MYVYCLPLGGLNDTLCQIAVCCQYALKHGRKLYVDTQFSGAFRVPFSEVFNFVADSALLVNGCPSELELLHLNSVETQFRDLSLSRVIQDLEIESEAGLATINGQQITFDFSVGSSTPLLIHSSFGGGWKSIEILHVLTLTPRFRSIIQAALLKMPRIYDAVHIRATDYQSDYTCLISGPHRLSCGSSKLLLSSDNQDVIEIFRDAFGDCVFSPELLEDPTLANKLPSDPLHTRLDLPYASRLSRTAQVLVDLLSLAGSRRLYFTRVENGSFSGYSMLALHIKKHSYIARQLLGLNLPPAGIIYLKAVRFCFLNWRCDVIYRCFHRLLPWHYKNKLRGSSSALFVG
jgi:hypothetical protein